MGLELFHATTVAVSSFAVLCFSLHIPPATVKTAKVVHCTCVLIMLPGLRLKLTLAVGMLPLMLVKA